MVTDIDEIMKMGVMMPTAFWRCSCCRFPYITGEKLDNKAKDWHGGNPLLDKES